MCYGQLLDMKVKLLNQLKTRLYKKNYVSWTSFRCKKLIESAVQTFRLNIMANFNQAVSTSDLTDRQLTTLGMWCLYISMFSLWEKQAQNMHVLMCTLVFKLMLSVTISHLCRKKIDHRTVSSAVSGTACHRKVWYMRWTWIYH